MSMVLTRSPLEPIGMNGGTAPRRRSARLSAEGAEENEPPAKRNKANGVHTQTVSTKEQDGDAGAASKKKKRVYEEDDEGFSFSKRLRSKTGKAPAVRTSTAERTSPAKPQPARQAESMALEPAPAETAKSKTAQKKAIRRFPDTPERNAAEKKSRPGTKPIPNAQQSSPIKHAHAKSHANHERSPSPFRARPVTVAKKRKGGAEEAGEETVTRIQLPFADTPVIVRNIQMRKASAENGSRRSSSGMRGRRASSLIDEGRGNEASETQARVVDSLSCDEKRPPDPGISTPPPSEQAITTLHNASSPASNAQENSADDSIAHAALPHSEVPTSEFYKHISAELMEARRMRCLLGWCGTRALPPKPEAPRDNTAVANAEFQALQAARVIQAELSSDLVTNGLLSDWYSRDESAPPQIPLRKKPNPRNVANAAKAEELERELERLKQERAEWDQLIASAAAASSTNEDIDNKGNLSPLQPDLLDSPQRAILEQLQAPTTEASTEPGSIQQRLRNISENVEFAIDQFAHGVHALSVTRDVGERMAERSLADAANVLEEREKEEKVNGKAVDPMDALRGLAKVLNARS